MIQNDEKKKIILILNTLKNNFNYESNEDYMNFISVIKYCIENNETDSDILTLLTEILTNIKDYKDNNGYYPYSTCSFKNFERISNNAFIKRTDKTWADLTDNIKKIISYRVLYPNDARYNHGINLSSNYYEINDLNLEEKYD